MQANGQIHEAEKLLLDEYESYGDKTDIYPLIILQTLGYIYLWTGQHEKARQIGQVLIQGATRSGILTMKNWGDYYLGVACYQRNDLEAADQYFTEILKNRYIAHAAAYRDAVAGLVLIHQIKGESSEACQIMETISRADLEETGTENSQTSSLRARLMLLQGDVEGAGRWVDTFSGLPPDQTLLWLEEPQVTRVRVLAARGTDADINLALQILDILDEIADRTHKISYKIELLALRALVLDTVAQRAVGETSSAKAAADSALMQALDLARPGGFIRVFVDLGVPMQRLLRRIERQDHSTEMIRRILAAFQEDDKNLPGNTSPAQQRRQPSLANSTLAEPLTRRELEVLTLLRDPLSIKEIAIKLNISHATASRHTANIYAKLGVNRRWDAVTRAEELNILPSD